MKIKKIFAMFSSMIIAASCSMSVAVNVNAEDYANYGMGDLEITQSEKQSFYSQFDESDCSIDLSNITSVPTACDLSTNEDSVYFPPIGSQGGIGSCTAWATTYYQYTYAANKLNDVATTSSNAYSPSWTYNFINGGGNNGTVYTDAYDVLHKQGALTLSEMPYNPNSYNYDFSWSNNTSAMMNALKTRMSYSGETVISSSGTPITSKTDNDLKQAKALLSTGHVLLVRVQAESGLNNWSFKNCYGNSSEYVAYRASAVVGGHAMAVVGYNDNVCCDVNGNGTIEASERGAFKIANSWGTNWKNDGYVWVLYDALNKVSANKTNNWENSESGARISIFARGAADDNTFSFIEVENYDVNMAGLLTINTNYRNKLKVDLFRNNKSTTVDANFISYLNVNNELKSFAPFNGSIVLDYSQLDDPASECTRGYYFGLDIQNSDSQNALTFSNISFKIIDDKFNVIKQISSLPTSIAKGNNVYNSVRVTCQKGDLNYDNSIDALDVEMLSEYNLGTISFSNLQEYLGDFNNDGIISNADTSALSRYLLFNGNLSAYELKKISTINQKSLDYMIANNYSSAEIQEIKSLNYEIKAQLGGNYNETK